MRAHAAVLLALIAACGTDPPTGAANGSGDDSVHLALECMRARERAWRANLASDIEPILAAGCKAIYREPLCRDAWDQGLDLDRVAEACRIAYCALLHPRPPICLRPYARAIDGWPTLNAAILERELGPILAAPLLTGLGVTPVVRRAGVHVDEQGIRVDGTPVASIDELVVELRRWRVTDVSLSVPSTLPHAKVYEVIEALKSAGIDDVELGTY